MPLPFAANAAEFRIRYVSATGLEALNVLRCMRTAGGAFDAADIGTVTGILSAAWTTELAPVISEEVFLADIIGTGLDAANSVQLKTSVNANGDILAGDSQLLPFQTSALINWRTATRGKSFRGKTFLVGFTEQHSIGGQVQAAVLNAANAWALEVRTNLDAAGLPLAIVSYYTGGDKNADPPVPSQERVVPVVTEVADGACDFNWKTQRRRQLAG